MFDKRLKPRGVSKIKVVVADDEFYGREIVKKYLQEYQSVEVIGEAANGEETIELIVSLKPDLVFLDIQMPGHTGFEVIEHIKNVHLPLIVFTTAYNNYALKAFEASAVDYLLKPFDRQRFDTAFNKAVSYLGNKNKNEVFGKVLQNLIEAVNVKGNKEYLHRLLVREVKRIFFVKTEEIYWFEASGDYVMLHTETRSHLINHRLQELEEKLNPEKFIRIHRSSIVNIDYILEFEPHFNGEYFITLRNKTRLKMSRTFRDGLRTHFADLFES